jgi:glycosyltransferase involved in cell wall biosynthesis
MKGKIGEAMAAGLPVVTTSIGAEGFGFTPGQDALISDTPEGLSSAIVRLLRDPLAYEAIRRAGWKFIADRFSPEAVEAKLLGFFDHVATEPVGPSSIRERFRMMIPPPVRYLLQRLRKTTIFRRI